MDKVTLSYFDCYAFAEPIRMALFMGGVEFEDRRFSYDAPREEYTKFKETANLEFG